MSYRQEVYQAAHERSRQIADRRQRPLTLRGLLRWAHAAYLAETPNLDHSGSHLDDDGAPTMAVAARAYLALTGRTNERGDDWAWIASRLDEDGWYRTPLRRAIESLPTERRLFLRDLVPEMFTPSDVAVLHGIPAWCAADVMYQSLVMLWDRFTERPLPTVSWLDRSESQRSAEQIA